MSKHFSHRSVRSYVTLAAGLSILLAADRPAAAQEVAPAMYDTTGTAWVYASYFRIPWPRVDSLIKLARFQPAWRAHAIEMGCMVDAEFLIHHTGNEYNVVLSTTYESFDRIGPGSEECGNRAWRETVPDSTLRAAIAEGRAWVFGDIAHYDVIYWVPYPSQP